LARCFALWPLSRLLCLGFLHQSVEQYEEDKCIATLKQNMDAIGLTVYTETCTKLLNMSREIKSLPTKITQFHNSYLYGSTPALLHSSLCWLLCKYSNNVGTRELSELAFFAAYVRLISRYDVSVCCFSSLFSV